MPETQKLSPTQTVASFRTGTNWLPSPFQDGVYFGFPEYPPPNSTKEYDIEETLIEVPEFPIGIHCDRTPIIISLPISSYVAGVVGREFGNTAELNWRGLAGDFFLRPLTVRGRCHGAQNDSNGKEFNHAQRARQDRLTDVHERNLEGMYAHSKSSWDLNN